MLGPGTLAGVTYVVVHRAAGCILRLRQGSSLESLLEIGCMETGLLACGFLGIKQATLIPKQHISISEPVCAVSMDLAKQNFLYDSLAFVSTMLQAWWRPRV